MKHSSIASATVALALAFGITAFAHEQASTNKPADQAGPQHSRAGHSAGSMELHRIMMKGQKMPMPMSGEVDKDFATMMTMHHRHAIEMSEVLLQHGKNPELKALATKMKASQQEEIEKLAPHTK